MKITNIEFIDHIKPEGCSCGTGYSEPDKFKITFDDGDTDTLFVDIWYVSSSNLIRRNFNDAIKNRYKEFPTNMDEAFLIYKESLRSYYSENDINKWFRNETD